MSHSRFLPFLLVSLLSLCVTVSAQDQTANGGLTDEELSIEAPAEQSPIWPKESEAVPFSKAKEIVLTPLAQGSYSDPQGRLVIDVIEQDNAFLGIRVQTPEGAPITGATAKTSIDGNSRLIDTSGGLLSTSDGYGIIELVVLANKMGTDVLTVQVGDARTEIVLNVLSFEAVAYPALPTLDGGIPWQDLMQARVTFDDVEVAAQFPESVSAQAGETVRIAGFMTPLEAEESQRWFLLTSSPPHCYFDIPGGPAGTVEVLAPGGVDISWEAIVVEGRFETIERGTGVVYRLHEAKQVEP
ncbi:MAG: hypothetical protein AB8F65_12780 [Woeseiaceae bacterium]